jgi:hypothetical protein
MKKLLFFLFAVAMTSCTCVMSQSIPAQYLYVDQSCGAAMPDYLPKFTFTDNCGIDTVWQSPIRGTWLTAPATSAMIRAIDKFGNHTDLMFTIHLLDTVPPQIILQDSTLITDNYEKINTLYNMADRILAYQEMWFDASFDWEGAGIPPEVTADNQYFNKILLTWTTPGYAFGNPGQRVHTFAEPGTSITFPAEL